jgi:aldehyde:ferredoxin oxidoreductase
MYAWAGKILYVNLSNKKVWTQSIPMEWCAKFMGGRGINAELLWDLMKPGIDPLSPENVLIFGAGALTGTNAPSSGRTSITCKGVLTNLYLKSTMGGHWGAELKFAGYDHLVVLGASENLVYIRISDEDVEIKDASHLLGMDVRTVDEELKRELGDDEVEVLCIGPAGENLVKFASVMNSVYNAAARGGVGAVMGAKKLKAIVVKGTGEISIKNPKAFNEYSMELLEKLGKDAHATSLHRYGTSGGVEVYNQFCDLPSFNFRECRIKDAEHISGRFFVEKGYLKRRIGCFSCPISCHRYTEINSGKFASSHSGGPEYETIFALGSGTGITDTETILKANELCNIFGLDTISTGVTIQWAMESFERGILTKNDTEDIDLRFGNTDAILTVIPMIAYRKGKIGSLLADGAKRAAEKIGMNSIKWAMVNSKGLEHSGVDTRFTKGYALAFAVNPRGPDHLHTQVLAEYGDLPERIALIKKITGDEKWASPFYTQYRAEIVRYYENCYAVTDALGFCTFTGSIIHENPEAMANIFSLATGINMNERELMLVGRRILTIEKCFNVREGADRHLDDLPWRIMNEPAPGRLKGATTSYEELNEMLDRYYELHEWDPKTSWPYRETLEKLDLKDVAKTLEEMKGLPNKSKHKF